MRRSLEMVSEIEKKVKDKQPYFLTISRWLIPGRKWTEGDYLSDGVLRAPDSDGRRCQELHNASHAAWIFSMVLYSILKERPRLNTGKRTNRAIAHLSCLREFIQEEDLCLRSVVNRLIKELKRRFPDNHRRWMQFVIDNWFLIRSFAAHYGYQVRCFPDSSYSELLNRYREDTKEDTGL